MYKITKTFTFSYGHRLMQHKGPCKNLHGHNAKVEIELSGDCLDESGMVEDFSEIKRRIKAWVDKNLDHRTLVFNKDILAKKLKLLDPSVVIMDFNPTAENLAKLIFDKAHAMDLPVTCVTFWETDTSRAIYEK
ncbi:6-carboxytetrahydropterin synthase QueD [Elusimicrobiota bacterium]